MPDAASGPALSTNTPTSARFDPFFLGSKLPLIQAPLAGVQDARLALAVCEAGGLGSLPAALLAPAALERELTELSQGARGPWNVNFFAHTPPSPDDAREQRWREALQPYFDEMGIDPASIQPGVGRQPFTHETADLVERFRPPIVSFHFGLPSDDLLKRVKGWGSRVLGCATTVQEAQWLEAHGADAVIAQGWEAGGHRGHFLDHDLTRQLGTFALLPQVVRAVSIPVIAAGGIADVPGIRAALALGASAVQLGTAFMLCREATTSAPHREALRRPHDHHTAVTTLFTGRPARGIVNRLMRELGPLNPLAPAFPGAGIALAPLRAAAESKGSGDFSPLWAGQNFAALKETDAATLIRDLSVAF